MWSRSSRSEENCDNAVATLSAAGVEAVGIVGDVRRGESVTELFERAEAHYGRIDSLVYSAGGSFSDNFKRGPLESLSSEDLMESYRLNVVGAFLCATAVLPAMRRGGGGSIVNISSLAGNRPSPGLMGAYGASKAAINNLTRTMGFEFAPEVRVNAVAPGHIDTPRTTANRSPERLAVITKAVALGRFGTPRDIGDLVAFLVSPAASWITAAVFDIDGGDTGVG